MDGWIDRPCRLRHASFDGFWVMSPSRSASKNLIHLRDRGNDTHLEERGCVLPCFALHVFGRPVVEQVLKGEAPSEVDVRGGLEGSGEASSCNPHYLRLHLHYLPLIRTEEVLFFQTKSIHGWSTPTRTANDWLFDEVLRPFFWGGGFLCDQKVWHLGRSTGYE